MCLNLWACSCEWWTHGVPGESSRVDATAIPYGAEELPGSGSLQSWDTLLESEWWIHGFRVNTPHPHCCCLCIFSSQLWTILASVFYLVLALKWDFLKFQWWVILLFADSTAPPLSGYPKDSSTWRARASHLAHFVDLPPVFPAFSTQPVGLLSFPKQPSCLTVSAAHLPRTLFLPLPHHKWAFARESS